MGRGTRSSYAHLKNSVFCELGPALNQKFPCDFPQISAVNIEYYQKVTSKPEQKHITP